MDRPIGSALPLHISPTIPFLRHRIRLNRWIRSRRTVAVDGRRSRKRKSKQKKARSLPMSSAHLVLRVIRRCHILNLCSIIRHLFHRHLNERWNLRRHRVKQFRKPPGPTKWLSSMPVRSELLVWLTKQRSVGWSPATSTRVGCPTGSQAPKPKNQHPIRLNRVRTELACRTVYLLRYSTHRISKNLLITMTMIETCWIAFVSESSVINAYLERLSLALSLDDIPSTVESVSSSNPLTRNIFDRSFSWRSTKKWSMIKRNLSSNTRLR